MKRLITILLVFSMLLTLSVLGAAASSPDVTADTWASLELQALYIQNDVEIFSDLNMDYFELMWDDEVPEVGYSCQACTVQMRGFAMSADGRYLYMGHLNGGSGVRGVTVYDTEKCIVTDLYYKYDGEAGHSGNPFSYAKGIDADDRGYVYAGFAFSKNYNIVNLGIAKQQDDGTLEEVYYDAIFAFGDPGDEGGIHVGVNGLEVAKVGDKYYCYAMINYDYDALYCIDVTDPENPKLNKDFGTDGRIEFSAPSNTVAGSECTLNEGYYMDVDEDGVIWLAFKANESGKNGIMKIAPDGSACADTLELSAPFSVEHVGGYLLCGTTDGSGIVVLDDASYETIATIPLVADNGDRVVRMYVINDVLFAGASGESNTKTNAVYAAPLSADGQEFLEKLIANMGGEGGEETTEAPAEETTAVALEETEPNAQETQTPAETRDQVTQAPGTTPVEKSGCSSVAGVAAVAVLMAAAVFVVRRKD